MWKIDATVLQNRARLLISCRDKPGIVAGVSHFLFQQGANIVDSDQYSTDPQDGMFFMRVEFDLPGLWERKAALEEAFAQVGAKFDMRWEFRYPAKRKRMAIFVSREGHCLLDLLWQWKARELAVEIPFVLSNHTDLKAEVEAFGIPFYYFPITPENKVKQEAAQLDLMEGRVDLVVLARYMQILTPAFLDRYPNAIINIHHSFLPAFVGAKPYHQAYERGVKVIGATAHYATAELDQGPIIEQDVTRVNHKDGPEELRRKGRNIERTVLSQAVKWHVEDRIIVHGNKTVVF